MSRARVYSTAHQPRRAVQLTYRPDGQVSKKELGRHRELEPVLVDLCCLAGGRHRVRQQRAADPDSLPPPDEVAAEIVASVELALEKFTSVAAKLTKAEAA